MFIGIGNTPRDYAWGSRTAIGALLGRPVSGGPEAELWLGAHPAAPSVVTDATPGLAGERLDAVIAEDPTGLLGAGRTRLPFLMKVLAADSPLSLQVHPDREQAREGFAREEAAGIPVGSPERNYRDDDHKPEIIVALSPTFEALAGFRHVSESRLLLAELAARAASDDRGAIRAVADRLAAGDPGAAGSTGSSGEVIRDGMPETAATVPDHDGSGNPLADTVSWLLHGGEDVERAVAAVTAAARTDGAVSSFAREWATVERLAEVYPGDPGIVLSLLLNRVTLQQGQALALPAGVMHAYLEGLGVEVMASSDNVLRGGLTPKHVDVDELLRVVRFEASPSPVIRPETPEDGVLLFRGPADDFLVYRVDVGEEGAVHGYRLAGPESASVPLTGPAVALCVAGAVTVAGTTGSASLQRGDAVLISPDEGPLRLTGSADVFLATTA